ncbi:hypothetical protein FCM35_KLT06414 [Carex littledalei]|uniref:RING-CH-type domain-containing protein n=1 Tax=Carex littledalei TaxID=544730 RepID=A0A833VLI0_9POAL|nr:hypothetical protein FCM35_KLT06414 [Carex littledalei]
MASAGDTPPPPPQVVRQSPAAIHSGAVSDDEEEEDLCRICRCAATSEDPLHYPCACRGSIKFVHQNCLLQWINHSSSHRCEVCRHTFSFTPIYAEKTPSRLSLAEQLTWLAAKTWTASKFFTRLALVLFVWFVIVPFVAAHFWDMVFIKTPRELGDVHWLHSNSNSTIIDEILCGQLIFLCTMLVAAALFISFELLGANRIPLLGDGALFQEHESFAEIIGMRGPAIKLVKRAFQAQLGIAVFLVIAVLVPFSWGRIILYQMNGGTGHASDWCMLAVGYISILGPGAIIAGLNMIRRFSKDISLSRSSIMKGLCACRSFVVRMVRQGFILMVVFGTFPCVCGWWFDICTMKMVQMQFGGLDHLLDFPPLRILVFWGCGIICLVFMKKFLLLIDEELQLREGILYSLQIPTDINQISIREFTDASLHDNAYRLLLNTAVFMTLTVVLVFLPFKLVSCTLPSFFPLNFILCYSPSGLHWNTLGRLLRSRYVSRHYNPHSACKFLLHHWLSFVAKALHLDDFLLPMNGDANGNASTSRFDEVKESQDDQVDSKYVLELVVKIAALLILGSLSLVLLTSATIIVPTSLGRAVFSLIMWIIAFNIGSNDEINFLVGCYIISDGIVAVRSFINFVGTRRILSVVQLAGKWCMIGLKCFALLSISVLFIPLQLGLLANLMIEMPLDVSIDERPVFYFHHIWVSGCILLSAWIRLVMSGVRDTNCVEWRAKFERVKADGFSRLRTLWVVREILWPIVSNLLTWLCVPYIFAKGVFPLLGCSVRTNSSVYHFAWLAYLLLSLLCYIVKRLYMCLASLHDRIKDDRYLIGTALCNFQQEDASTH